MAKVVLLDTGPLVAILDQSETDHAWASEQLKQLRGSLLTCAAVVSEAMFLLRKCHTAKEHLERLIARSLIIPVGEDVLIWKRALMLMKCYENVPMSFADACLVAIAETHVQPRVFTLDRDFLIYRQHGRDPLALLAPFVSSATT
jgi:predicted nucleic acid-binding protein